MHPAGHGGAAAGVSLSLCLISCLESRITGFQDGPLLPLPSVGLTSCLAARPPACPQASASVVAQAKGALDNPRLCGEPQLRDAADGMAAAPAFGAAPGASADDGLASGATSWQGPGSWLLAACTPLPSCLPSAVYDARCRCPCCLAPAGFDMGAVVPVAEPEWSGAHHGLCLYASRVLQAVWDEQVGGAGAWGGGT